MSDQAEDVGVLEGSDPVQELGAQVAQLTAERDEAREDLARATDKYEEARHDLEQARAQLSALEDERDGLSERVQLAETEAHALTAEVEQFKAQAERLQSALDAETEGRADDATKAAARDLQLRQQLDTALNNGAAKQVEVEALGVEVQNLREQIEPLESQARSVRRRLDETSAALREIQEQTGKEPPMGATVQVGWVGVDGSLRKVNPKDQKDAAKASSAAERAVFAIDTPSPQ